MRTLAWHHRRAIHVREGDEVVKGQAIITLKSAMVNSSVDMANKNLIFCFCTRNRYQAEKIFFSKYRGDSELLDLVERYGSQDVLESEQIFDARHASYKSQTELLESQIIQLTEQILGFRKS